MSVLFGSPAPRERRDEIPEPPIPPNSDRGSSYARVNLSRAESSLQKVAVWASVDLLAGTASMLPIDVYEGDGDDARQIAKPAWMLDPAGDGHDLEDWIWQLMFSWLLRGNGVGIVAERDRQTALPTQIVLQHPDEAYGHRDLEGKVVWRVGGKEVPTPQVWHQRVYPTPGRVMGLSPIEHHALTVGTGIAAMRFGAQWFEDGAHPSGILASERSLDADQAKTAKSRFMAALRGTREPVVLGQGWKWQQVQIAPNESQFLQTNGYTSAECCRIYGPGIAEILGYETGGSLTYQNIEQRNLQLLIYALDKWLTKLERVFTALLPVGQYVKVNRGALLRTDILTRYRAHEISIRSKFMAQDEVRELEERPPLTPAQTDQLQTLGATGAPATPVQIEE